MHFRNILLAGLLGATVLSVHAAKTVYTAALSGANETPATGSLATGFATVIFDNSANSLEIQLSFAGLSAPAMAGHIHCCTLPGTNAAVALPFTGLPNATSGSYDNTFDLGASTTYTAGFLSFSGGTVASAEATLLAGIAAGEAYVNLHDANFPGGEVRGFLVPAVPEPGTWVMCLAGLGLIGCSARRRVR